MTTTTTTSMLRRLVLLSPLALLALAIPADAQQASSRGESEFRWAKAVPSGRLVRLSNVSGDITVIGADVERVELVARRRGSSDDSEARVEVREHADGVTICALRHEESTCDERGAREDRGSRWGRNHDGNRAYYDLEVRVPRRMRISAGTVSGDVRVSGTQMGARAASVSGDVRLEALLATGEVSATTVSGDVTARLDALAAGTNVELKTVSGDVRLAMPRTAGFDLDMSTVSGDLESDFPLAMRGRFNRRSISAQVNNGGSDLRVSTVSGDVRIAHIQ